MSKKESMCQKKKRETMKLVGEFISLHPELSMMMEFNNSFGSKADKHSCL